MKADKWLEVNLVGLVILGGLMFVMDKLLVLNTALSDVQAKLIATSGRVDHIAEVLPDVATRIAEEQISRPLRTVVIESAPSHGAGKKYSVLASIIDTQTGERWTASIPLGSPSDLTPLAAMAWSGYQLDEGFASFSRMEGYARTASFDSRIPQGINPSVSFVLGSTAGKDYLSAISHLGFSPKEAAVHLKVTDWKDLAQALSAQKAALLPAVPPSS